MTRCQRCWTTKKEVRKYVPKEGHKTIHNYCFECYTAISKILILIPQDTVDEDAEKLSWN